MRLAFCGAHRTGKSTLARALQAAMGMAYVETHNASVYIKAGVNVRAAMPFSTRLAIQNQVLDAALDLWKAQRSFITDRSPLCMLAYTLAEIQGSTEADMVAVAEYTKRCFDATKRYFDGLVLVQPGIPLVEAPGKGALNPPYIEHLNSLVMGFLSDDRQHTPYLVIKRSMLGLHERLNTVTDFYQEHVARVAPARIDLADALVAQP